MTLKLHKMSIKILLDNITVRFIVWSIHLRAVRAPGQCYGQKNSEFRTTLVVSGDSGA